MKQGKITILFMFMTVLTMTSSFGQNIVYSTIAKNINSNANSLQHNLNKAGDTLHLSSDYNLYKVEFIGTYEAKVFEVERNTKKTSIPLASVPVGEYTIAAFQIEKSDDIYQYQKTIVFRISRILPIEPPFVEEDVIAEVAPEIKEEEPIIEEEETLVASVEVAEPAVKEKKKRPTKVKKEVVRKKRVKKEVVSKKKTKVALRTPKPKKEYIKTEKPLREKKVVVKEKPIRKTRVVERKEPSLDSTEYKSYNLTNGRGGRYVVQSREEYRANNLRPNGEPYN